MVEKAHVVIKVTYLLLQANKSAVSAQACKHFICQHDAIQLVKSRPFTVILPSLLDAACYQLLKGQLLDFLASHQS